ncbi:histidine kinase [Pedobacter sp.]|uniref:histidine kinase n=1 Tax=Pedobacter sp. TaxID=1411316 RepID=UPI003BA8F966
MLYEQIRISYLFAAKKFAEAEQQQEILLKRVKVVYEKENASTVAEMGVLFQLEAKDKSIHNLSETVTLSQTKLLRNTLWLAVSTLTFLLAISVAFLLYFFHRQKKLKTESEKVQLDQQLLRTQMEPHFIFNTLSALQSFIRF